MDGLGINSPPRPQRLIRPTVQLLGGNELDGKCKPPVQIKTDLVVEFQAQQVDRSMSALPTVFTEVFSMQKAQTDELHKQQNILDGLKEQINEGEIKKDELQQETRCVMNKIYQLEETIKDSNKTNRALHSDIKALVVKLNDTKNGKNRKEEKIQAQLRKMEQQMKKCESFAERVKQFEKTNSKVYQKLQEVRKSLESLNEQEANISYDEEAKCKILDGEMASDIRTMIDSAKINLEEVIKETATMESQIGAEESKQKKLKQTLQVLQKRNAAQLTKLKRHMKEMQLRNRQRQTQVKIMREKVAEATQQIKQ